MSDYGLNIHWVDYFNVDAIKRYSESLRSRISAAPHPGYLESVGYVIMRSPASDAWKAQTMHALRTHPRVYQNSANIAASILKVLDGFYPDVPPKQRLADRLAQGPRT